MPPRNHHWLPILMPRPSSTPLHARGQGDEAAWFAVRFVLAHGRSTRTSRPVHEERLTAWRAAAVEEAVARATTEARAYAATFADARGTWLGPAQVYRLVGKPGDGSELFSSSPHECEAPHLLVGASGAEVRS
jgi:hypothetical protein